MTIKAREMVKFTEKAIKLKELRDKVLEHAKTYAKDGMYSCDSYLHIDEFAYLHSVNAEEFQEMFSKLGYVASVNIHKNEYDGYIGKVTLRWDLDTVEVLK